MVDRRRQRARWYFPGVAGVLLVGALTFGLPSGGPITISDTGAGVSGWTMHTILAGANGAGFPDGADGIDMADVDGDGLLDVAVGHEQGLRATLSFNPGTTGNLVEGLWPTVTLPSTGGNLCSPEDVAIADVDLDGALDLVAACETGLVRVTVLYAPTPPNTRSELLDPANWTRVDLTASATNGRAMRVRAIDLAGDSAVELVVGGKESDGPPEAAHVGYYSSATPRVAASWTFTSVVPAGWVMNMYVVDFNADGDLDIIYSDRDPINTPGTDNSKRGVRWLDSDGADPPAFTERTISAIESVHKWFMLLDWDGDLDLDVLDCRSDPSINTSTAYINGGGGLSWTTQSIPQPSGVGQCQHAYSVDWNLDTFPDLTFSYSNGEGLSTAAGWTNGVASLTAPSLSRLEISGILSTTSDVKMDNQFWDDVDQDGDQDLLLTEQHVPNDNGPGIGVVYFENPTVTFEAPPAPSAITCSSLTSGYSAVGATSIATASVSPGSNRLIVAVFQSALAAGPAAPTVTGNGLTWVQIQTLQYHTSNARRITFFRALGAAPTPGAITASYGATSQTAFSWSIVECANVDTSGTNGSGAVVQNATNTATGATSISNTLAALGAATSVHLGAVALAGNNATTPDPDFAELSDNGGNTGAQSLEVEWAANQTVMTPTFGTNNAGAISIEVKIAP